MRHKDFIDLREIIDEVFAFTEDFRMAVEDEVGTWKKKGYAWGEHRDYYPAYSYPPMNVYLTADKSMVFEFALAGFKESDISLEFRGDYLFFSATAPVEAKDDDLRYFKRRLKFKDIKEQRYFVPEDRFKRDEVRAVFKDSILKVSVPAKDETEQKEEGVKVNIVSEGDSPKMKRAEKTDKESKE